jgi:hypothetical protein
MGGRQHTNIQPTPPMFDQRAGGLAPAAIDIVREEIAGAFQDKLGVSMVPGGQSYRKPYDNRFDHHPYPQGTRILEFAKFSGDQGKKHARTHRLVLSTIRRIGRYRSISRAFIFIVFNRNCVRMVRHVTS